MKKLIFIIVIVGSLLVVGFFAFNSYIYNQKQGDGVVERYQGTLSGEYVCLPHRDTGGPQTLECAYGIKTEAGEYYALDFNLIGEPPALKIGDKFNASGQITPIEMLSGDQWNKYPIQGIFSVTDPVRKL